MLIKELSVAFSPPALPNQKEVLITSTLWLIAEGLLSRKVIEMVIGNDEMKFELYMFFLSKC